MNKPREARRDLTLARLVAWLSSGRSSPPRYRLPWPMLARFGVDLALGRRRSLVADAQRVMALNPYPRRFEGMDNLPRDGRFLLVANHYARPGLQPYHWALAVTAAMAERWPSEPHVHWLFSGEWSGRYFGPIPIPPFVFRLVFSRVAYVHDLVALPVQPGAVMNRAVTFKRLLELARRGSIALVPEGSGSGVLQQPPAGSGLLLQALHGAGLNLVPAGVWEEDDELVVRFGTPFGLAVPKEAPRDERDRLAQEQVMVAIGRLLPEAYWGVYAAPVGAASGEAR